MQFNLILCPVDFSDFSASAYEYALTLAEHYKVRLVALHVVELSKYPYADYAGATGDLADLSRVLCEGGKAKLREFVTKHSRQGIEPQLVVDQGNTSDLILSCAQTHNADLIVMGTHGRRGFDRFVLGSTTDRVMRKACCPVQVVSNPAHNIMTTGPDGRHRLNRIICCTDFSVNSERALQYALFVAEEYGAELTMLHVVEGALDLTTTEAIIADRTEQLNKLISEDQRKHLNIKTAVRRGKSYQEIVGYAKEVQAHLIIMTARGGDALDRAVFGSTTYRVIQLGPCPVLAVHT
jgi:nucleotide-binding universal stress UspA family protein